MKRLTDLEICQFAGADTTIVEDQGDWAYLDIRPAREDGASVYLEPSDVERLRDWLTAWLESRPAS